MTRTRTASWLAPCALLGLALTGCGGSSSHSAAGSASTSTSNSTGTSSAATSSAGTGSASTGPAASNPSAPAFASTSAGSQTSRLSKPDFLIRMNALCSAVDAQRKALPTPAGPTDYAAISTNISATMRLLPSLISHAEALIAQSADRALLEKNWLSVEKADYAVIKPIAQRLVTDSNAHDAAKVRADGAALDAAPDHSRGLSTFLTGYGLSSCASLESS